jgi:hypothetical protein
MKGYEMHDTHEVHEMKHRHQIVVEEEEKMVANAYPGQRTDQTKDEQTRVRVRSAIRLEWPVLIRVV